MKKLREFHGLSCSESREKHGKTSGLTRMTSKKWMVCMLLAVLPALGFSQSEFDRFEAMDDVSAVIVNQNMFKLFSRIEADDPEAKEFMSMVKSLKNLKVFSTENKAIAKEMQSTMNDYIKKSSLEELMRVKDKGSNVKFYIRPGRDEDHVSELLMFVSGMKDVEIGGTNIETVLLSLTGDIDLNKISMLTKKMNLPSELDEAGKNR